MGFCTAAELLNKTIMKLYLVSRIEWDANAEADKRFFATPIHIEAKRKYNEWALQFQSEIDQSRTTFSTKHGTI